MRKYKRPSHQKRLAIRALAESGLSEGKVAKIVGVAPSTVHAIKCDPDLSPDRIIQMKDLLPGKYYKLAHRAMDNISDEKLSAMNGYQLILTSKISADAGRMCEGLPTKTIQIRSMALNLSGDINDVRSRKEKLLRTLGGTTRDLHDATATEGGPHA